MARSVTEIKGVMTEAFMGHKEMQLRYGFAAGAKWNEVFSAVSVENILFYVVAVVLRGVEMLFDSYKGEVTEALDERLPHTVNWYKNMVLGYVMGAELDSATGRQITDTMSEGEVEAARQVKFAAVTADVATPRLVVKVAGGESGNRAPIAQDVFNALQGYMAMVKDAGVVIDWVNSEPARLNVAVDVVYGKMYAEGMVMSGVGDAITGYIQSLPLDGEFTKSGLTAAVMLAVGVMDVYVTAAAYREPTATADVVIDARCTTTAGYMCKGVYSITMTAR